MDPMDRGPSFFRKFIRSADGMRSGRGSERMLRTWLGQGTNDLLTVRIVGGSTKNDADNQKIRHFLGLSADYVD